jgi:hypothetical protein
VAPPGEGGWLSVKVDPSRASEVNRALAQAGIYASGIDTGSDLEGLFLGLTGGEPAGEGRALFFGAAGAGPTARVPEDKR